MGGRAGRIIKLEAGRVIQIPRGMNANITGLRVTWQHVFCKANGPWCWERLKAGGEGDDRGWDGWMASPTQWTRVWVNSGSWWCTGRPGVLQSVGSQRVGHVWVTELNWTELNGPWMGNPLQYYCLDNPLDRRFCWATVHRFAKTQKWLR